jgi:hypothetical protein
MPGFKSDQRGEMNDLVGFVSRIYVDEQRALQVYQGLVETSDGDVASQNIFRRLVQDQSAHVSSVTQLIDWLAEQGYGQAISAAIVEDGVGAMPGSEESV